jgi:decaprenylphospho-beta-D-ribofuranose 2-oxidase
MAGPASGGGVIARGAGRSYGDAAQNDGGLVLDLRGLDGPSEFDADAGVVRAGAGTTLARVLLELAARGLTLPVVPGTRHVTVGGAIASDVHGKNHPREGSFAHHLESLLLCTPEGQLLRVSPQQEPELFCATVGGMGLTGIILEATLRARPMPSSRVRAHVERTHTLAQAIALLAQPGEHTHAIAWLDLLSRGSRFGRAVVTRSYDAGESDPDDARGSHGSARSSAPFRTRPFASVPSWFPGGALRPATVAAFNAWHWHAAARARGARTLSMSANLFPLDALGDWNRLYGHEGLLQYQFALPLGKEEELIAAMEQLGRSRLPMYLAVLKRFGSPSGGLLSFPIEGWTMAIDFPAGAPGVRPALDRLDERVAAAGGRIYLAKDARAGAAILRSMYPGLARFLSIRSQVDPEQKLRSDLGRRLGLCRS